MNFTYWQATFKHLRWEQSQLNFLKGSLGFPASLRENRTRVLESWVHKKWYMRPNRIYQNLDSQVTYKTHDRKIYHSQDNPVFFYSTFVCVCMVHVCIFACMWVCIMWACSSVLFMKEESLNQNKSSLIMTVLLAYLLWKSLCSPSKAGTTDELPWRPVIYMSFWGSDLQFSW